VAADGSPSRVDEARAVVDDDDHFATAEAAANALLQISSLLGAEAEECSSDDAGGSRRDCRAYFAGAGHARTGSIGLLRCARPEVFDAREAMRSYLETLDDDPASARLPMLPYCT
jgi:hypothetical protein